MPWRRPETGDPMLQNAIDLTRTLVEMPSISTDSNMNVIWFLHDKLTKLGARCDLSHDATGGKANLWATIGPDIDGGVVLSGHTDVVPVEGQEWTNDPFQMVEADGNLYGRGTCDMKGFIACALAVAPEFAKADLKRPLHFAFTYDEETGCLGAKVMLAALKESGRRPAVCIIGEPTGMKVIEGHKGCCENTTTFWGLEGHGSMPSAGVNAVEYAAQYIGELMRIGEDLKPRAPDHSRFDPPWTTINIGAISGGVAHNVIPNVCRLDWEFRPINRDDKAFVRDRIATFTDRVLLPQMQATFAEAAIDIEFVGDVDGLEPMENSEAVALAQELTGGNSVELVPFGTEAGLFQELGISTVVCGPGYIAQAHKPDEFVAVAQIEACLAMLMRLLPKLAR